MTKNHILIRLSESKQTKFGKEEFARQFLPQKVFSDFNLSTAKTEQAAVLPAPKIPKPGHNRYAL
jgi:hypothetical protein